MTTPSGETVPRSGYRLEQVALLLGRFLLEARLSFRATARVVEALLDRFADWERVSPGTLCNWLVRLGTWAFTQPKEPADDWILLVDHSIQLGPEKCLAVFGVRSAHLPPPGEALQLCDLQPVGLFVEKKSDKHVVHQQLQEVAHILGGPPLAILSDEGSDLVAGIQTFCHAHETIALSDIAHKATNLLKQAILADADEWADYNQTVSRIASRVRLTDAAFLSPPSQRSKARFMNLGAQLDWAEKMLVVMDTPEIVAEHLPAERLEEKFGRLRNHRGSIEKWSRMQKLCEATMKTAGSCGYGEGTLAKTQQAIRPHLTDATEPLAGRLADFVRSECAKVPSGMRVASSTEVLESAFGVYKARSGDHAQGGFTRLLPSFGALVGKWDVAQIGRALLETPLKVAEALADKLLGTTYRSQRRAALSGPSLAHKKPCEP